MQRVHQALLVHRRPWTTRGLATYTNLPQTSVRRQLEMMEQGRAIDRTVKGVQISDLGAAFAINFHGEPVRYVRVGRRLSAELLDLLKRSPSTEHMDFDMLETHIWWPIIEAPEIDDA